MDRVAGRLPVACDFRRGFDSAISEVVNYARRVDDWMRAGGRAEIAASLGIKADAA